MRVIRPSVFNVMRLLEHSGVVRLDGAQCRKQIDDEALRSGRFRDDGTCIALSFVHADVFAEAADMSRECIE
jgi:hypothetical protein